MSTYDKYYMKKDYFGNPYHDMMRFFENITEKGSLVDLGAGQGRDSIPLSKMGFDVTSVDISSVGLDQIKKDAPKINTINHDLYTFDVSTYDFILLNSILHFYKKDREKESVLAKRLLVEMKPHALFINCLLKSAKRESIFKKALESAHVEHDVLDESYIDYPDKNSTYHFYVIKKI